MDTLKKEKINKDLQIKKFCAYGFLKNLKFFEPYLIVFLIHQNISLMEIGILLSIREIIINIFEIPSGFIADYFGRKKELASCFVFYIISFVCFYFTRNFYIAAIAMIFFGLGEAFRSGTHKAMIYTYLDKRGWADHKTFVYGRTRSFSLVGSAISSILAIIIVLKTSSTNLVFLFSIIPYLLDLILILSYPKEIDMEDFCKIRDKKNIFSKLINNFRECKNLKRIIIEDGYVASTISYGKDLVQPIMEIIIMGSGITMLSSFSLEDNLKVLLGIIYGVFNILGAFSSRYSYKIKLWFSTQNLINYFHIVIGLIFFILAIFSKQYIVVIIVYIVLYMIQNFRKPIFMAEIDDFMNKENRATVLSITSQLKSVFLMIMAPILGYVGDVYGIGSVMGIISFGYLLLIPFTKINRKEY